VLLSNISNHIIHKIRLILHIYKEVEAANRCSSNKIFNEVTIIILLGEKIQMLIKNSINSSNITKFNKEGEDSLKTTIQASP